MTNPDNVGGLPTADQLYDIAADAWDQHQTNCRVTTTAGSLRKAVEAIHRELCRAAPAGGDDYEARYATPERLAKPAATVKCDFCGVRPGELHAYDCTALDSAPSGSGEVSRLELAKMELAVTAALFNYEQGDTVSEWLKNTAALLRKLQQGADAPKES